MVMNDQPPQIGPDGKLPSMGWRLGNIDPEYPPHGDLVRTIRWRAWAGESAARLANELDVETSLVNEIISGSSHPFRSAGQWVDGPIKGENYNKPGEPLSDPVRTDNPNYTRRWLPKSGDPPEWLGEYRRRSVDRLSDEDVERLRWAYLRLQSTPAGQGYLEEYGQFNQLRHELNSDQSSTRNAIRGAKPYQNTKAGPIPGHHYKADTWPAKGLVVDWEIDQDQIPAHVQMRPDAPEPDPEPNVPQVTSIVVPRSPYEYELRTDPDRVTLTRRRRGRGGESVALEIVRQEDDKLDVLTNVFHSGGIGRFYIPVIDREGPLEVRLGRYDRPMPPAVAMAVGKAIQNIMEPRAYQKASDNSGHAIKIIKYNRATLPIQKLEARERNLSMLADAISEYQEAGEDQRMQQRRVEYRGSPVGSGYRPRSGRGNIRY